MQYTATVVGNPSKIMEKSNGNQYVLINCQVHGVIDKKTGKDIIVPAQRTILNADSGEVKEVPEIGTEVVLYLRQLPSDKEKGKFVSFFQLSLGGGAADQAAIFDAFGLVEEPVVSQEPA